MRYGIILSVLLWLTFPLAALELTPAEQHYLKQLGSVKVCVDPDWAPFEWITPEGEYFGIAADLLRLIASRSGITLELLPTSNWDESIAASRAGRCPIVSFLNQTPKREEWLIFTQPHFIDPNVFITREEHPFIADPASLNQETIALPSGTSIEEHIRRDYPNLRVVITQSEAEAFELVTAKKADMTMRSLIVAAYTIRKQGYFNLKIAGKLDNYANQLRIGILKSEPLLRYILSKGITTLTAQERESIINQQIAIVAQTTLDYRLITYLLLGIVVAGLIVALWIRQLKCHNHALLHLARTDLLTQAHNRLHISELLRIELERCERYQRHLGVILIDIDHFKQVNDQFGHSMGDRILVETVQAIRQSLRSCDAIGRWGGEEFLLLCPESDLKAVTLLAERVRSAVEQFPFTSQRVHTISLGATTWQPNDSAMTLIDRADQALYEAKNSGRNRACYH